MAHGPKNAFDLGSSPDGDHITGHVGGDDRELAATQMHRAFPNDSSTFRQQLIRVVWQVEHQLCLAEHAVNLLVNLGTIRSGPLNHPLELAIELAGTIDECIDVPGLIAGTSVDEKMQRAVAVWSQRVQEVIAAAQITQPPLVGTQAVGQLVPDGEVKAACWDNRAQKSHTAATIGNRESPPVRLARQYGGACRERGLPGAGIG